MDLGKADRKLRNLKSTGTKQTVSLGGSIVCIVSATGGNRALYLLTKVGGRMARFPLGTYPTTTVSKAYEEAQRVRAEVREGRDPRVERRRVAVSGDIPRTLEELADRFVERHLKVNTRAAWAKEAERLLRTEVIRELGLVPLGQLQRSDLAALIERKAAALRTGGGTGATANRLSAVISKMMIWSAQQGWTSFDLAIRLPKPIKELPRDRVLTKLEVGQFWNLLQEIRETGGVVHPVYARVLSLLALGGARTSELVSAEDAVGLTSNDVDLKAGTFLIKKGKTSDSVRTIVMPPVMRQIIEEAAEAAEGPDDLLFQLPRGGRIPSREVSRAARKIVRALGHKKWTPRDLRRTVATILGEEGVSEATKRRITGHAGSDVHDRIYDRSERLKDVLEGLRRVEAYVLQAADEARRPERSSEDILGFQNM